MSTKAKYGISVTALILTVILMILLKTVDVAPIGPMDTTIGLSHLNQTMRALIGTNDSVYTITQVAGLFSIGVAGCFALLGLIQWIRRRSVRKVDKELLYLAGLYAIVIVLYVLFDIVAINYRPVIMPGETSPEPSFPSTHAMLGCVIMGSAYMLADRYIERDVLRMFAKVLCVIVLIVVVGGRMLSGVHWFTDILGGILISICLLSCYSALLDGIRQK